MTDHIKYMHMAIEEARKGILADHGGPFGSVIVKDGEVIASEHNMVLSNNDATAHGEVSAIRAAGQKIGTYDLSAAPFTLPASLAICACAPVCGQISTKSITAAR